VYCCSFNVHSPFKQPTAARLARAALPLVYNVSVDTVTPLAGAAVRTGDKTGITLTIKNAAGGVAPLRSSFGFEVRVAASACPLS